MRAILDTHVLLWWLADDSRLGVEHKALISASASTFFVSAVSIAEIAIKASLGKLTVPGSVAETVEAEGFASMPLTAAHAEQLRELPWHHRDPFDRMLIAQAMVEGVPLLTVDRRIQEYDVDCR